MRRFFPIALVVLWTATTFFSRPVLAQQAKGPRQIITKVIPRYPDLARPMRLEGTVKLTVTVAPNGNLGEAKVENLCLTSTRHEEVE